MKITRSSSYPNRIWLTICHRRKKYFVLKIVLFITSIWLIIASFVRFIKLFHQEIDESLINFDYDFIDRDDAQSRDNYKSIFLDVPHYKEMNQSSLELPGFGDPGEYGEPVTLVNLSSKEKELEADGWEKHAFNEHVSNIISLHRRLPDVRPRGCRNEKYSPNLPKTSVIICFHNEAWSVLLRTIHSVLDRSPSHLIQEIILIDDFSNLPHLDQQLENYVSSLKKVKILRAKKREGLIRSRLMGVSVAKAPILTFLDSHCECAPGWLEPLLQRIYDDWMTVVCPVIDTINDETFRYEFRESEEYGVGGFNWDLDFDWRTVPEEEMLRRNNPWEPVRSPTMPGGIFSISKMFFYKLGKYDEGFEIWGAENLELSFKTWMCGGILEILPCSRVGHVFRARSPYEWKPGENVFERNTIRLAEVWLDEYKHYFYRRIGVDTETLIKQERYGDVTSRKELRNKLNCKSFDWYLKNIYPEQYIPNNTVAEGEIRNLGLDGDSCLDGPSKVEHLGKHLQMSECHSEGENQYFIFTTSGEIRRDQACLDYAGDDISFFFCHGDKGNQLWLYDIDTQNIKHATSEKCLEMTENKKNVTMEICSESQRQRWNLQNFDPLKLRQNL